jgi:hypothetical protein
MKHSLAIVQPSLFEGWSTVIEDAKSLGVGVIASSLEVNKEQLMDKGVFFSPHDDKKLANILTSFKGLNGVEYGSYNERVRQFAEAFVTVFRKVG